MPRIAILPTAVADQIAAGEVVERPASVVKELIENALDARATVVEVAIEDGGRRTIRVSDDGTGMDRDDALLALARHATSKIRTAADLVGVRSFGFRGEALPAIASVAELTLETSTQDGGGTFVRAVGGDVLEAREAARRRGTTVQVSRLFYNTPARRKFLRGARSEWRGITDVLSAIALIRRDVHLMVRHDNRTVLALPPVSSLRERLAALWGAGFVDRLIDLEDVRGEVHLSGLVERPSDVGTAGRRVYLAVNGRVVRDSGIVRAAESAYRTTLPPGVRPSFFLELVVPADLLDVNVHPAKAEVRFRDRWQLERAVERAVRRALGTFESGAALGTRRWFASWQDAAVAPGVDVEVLAPPAIDRGPLFAFGTVPDSPAGDRDDASRQQGEDAVQLVPPLIQLRRTYLMFERDDGVVLIDQHSAHERVLFEQFMRVLEGGDAAPQRLLFPLTLHLGPAEGEALETNRDLFERLGFDIEGFGGRTLVVHTVPTPHPRFDAERCLRETLDALTGDRVGGTSARHERLAATVACKAAIKAGDQLSSGEMRALFLALGRTTLPAHDVHGRSTIVHLSWDELERRFGRR